MKYVLAAVAFLAGFAIVTSCAGTQHPQEPRPEPKDCGPKVTFMDGEQGDDLWVCGRESSGGLKCAEFNGFMQFLAEQSEAPTPSPQSHSL